jgi:hypothetical protein
MLQNMRNQPGEHQENSGSTPAESQDRNRFEGFEGMNYEQIRQPYQPHSVKNTNSDDSQQSGSGAGRRENV